VEKLRALERHTLPDRSWDLDAALKKLGEARRERAALFDNAGVKTALDALDEIAARNRAALAETLQFEADRGVSANYRGAYGVAAYKRSPLEEVSFTKLEELVPSLAPLIVKETTTRRSLADALNDLGRGDELDDIWDEINVETGDRSSPKLVIQITGETKAPKAHPNKKNSPKQEPTGDISKEDMMRGILEAEIGRLQVIRAHGLGDTLAILEGRITRYAERILELLENEAVDPTSHAHVGPHGSASFTTRRVTKLDVELLKEKYPEVAERCLIPTITKGHLTATLRDSGAEPATAQNILRQVFRRTDTLGPARVQISPNYGLFYKGLELDPEVEASGDYGDFDEPV
jgi:hypothetical protein